MSSVPLHGPVRTVEWHLPSKGRVGMMSLIVGESAIFTIFVVAYVFYLGKSLTGPKPSDVLEVPILGTICLLSSSLTIWRAERAIEDDRIAGFSTWLGATIALALVFLRGTALEWRKLIYHDGLTISTNLFGHYVLFASRSACDPRCGRPFPAHSSFPIFTLRLG